MSPSEKKSKVHQLLAARYPADLWESLAAGPEKVASIVMLASDGDRQADCSLSDFTGGPVLGR